MNAAHASEWEWEPCGSCGQTGINENCPDCDGEGRVWKQKPAHASEPIIMNCELYDNGKGIPSDSRALYMNCIIHCNGESQTKEGE